MENMIKRVFDNMNECVVLLLNSKFNESLIDIVLIFIYKHVVLDRSPIHSTENDDVITLLNEFF